MTIERSTAIVACMSLVVLIGVTACDADSDRLPLDPTAGAAGLAPAALAQAGGPLGEWQEPVLLDAAVNSPFRDLSPTLSPDKLSLYFNTNRPAEGLGALNIWVSQRACLDCPWEPARPLPAPVNAAGVQTTATLSRDGHLLFWSSDRDGSEPVADGSALSLDLWMASRRDPRDDFGWESPVRVGSAPGCEGDGRVNTEASEFLGSHVVAAPGGHAHLYFQRDVLYRVTIDRHGQAVDCAVRLPGFDDFQKPSVRADGREIVFWGGPAQGGLGGADLWVSTRGTVVGAWSEPVNVGAPVNGPFADLTPSLSHDGTTLVWSSGAARGGLGLQDIWISTRTRAP